MGRIDTGAELDVLDALVAVAAAGTEYELGEVARVEGAELDVAEPTGTTMVAELEPSAMVVVTEEALDDDADVIEAAEDASLAELDDTEVIEAAEDVSDDGVADVTDETGVGGAVIDDTWDVVAVVPDAVVAEPAVVLVVDPEVLPVLW